MAAKPDSFFSPSQPHLCVNFAFGRVSRLVTRDEFDRSFLDRRHATHRCQELPAPPPDRQCPYSLRDPPRLADRRYDTLSQSSRTLGRLNYVWIELRASTF